MSDIMENSTPNTAQPSMNAGKRGLVMGAGIAAIVVIAILGVVFKDKIQAQFAGDTSGAPKVQFVIVEDSKCTDCYNYEELVTLIRDSKDQLPINESKKLKKVAHDSREGKALIAQYGIGVLPTLLITGEINQPLPNQQVNASGTAPTVADILGNLGELKDNAIVSRMPISPYVDIASGEVKGRVTVIYLADGSCAECYDVKLHTNALKNLHITPTESKDIDVSSDEGKQLVSQYQINLVPTILLKGDLSTYVGFDQLWSEIGTTTSDGTHIFTHLELMGPHKDLKAGKVITPEVPQVQIQ